MTLSTSRPGPGRSFADLRDAFRARVFALREVAFPGGAATARLPGTMRVRLLSEREMDAARIAAISYVVANRVDVVVDRDELLEREVRRQIIWRAFFVAGDSAEEPAPFFPADSDVRELDASTVDSLFDAYVQHQTEIGDETVPSDEALDEAADRALAEGESGARFLAAALDARALRALVLRLMSRQLAAKGASAEG